MLFIRSVIIILVFLLMSVVEAGNYAFFQHYYSACNAFNSVRGTEGKDWRLRCMTSGGTYLFRIYKKYPEQTWSQAVEHYPDWSGSLGGGENLYSSYLGSTYTGYDMTLVSGNVYITSAVIPINVTYFANAGNDAYFPAGYLISVAPGCNTGGSGSYSGVFWSMADAHEYEIGSQDCYDIFDPFATPTPTPSSSPTPSPSPTSTVSPSSSPSPEPSWTPENYPSPISQVGTLTGNIELNTNGSSTTGNFSATIQMPDQEQLSPYFQSGQAEENKINEIENGAYDAEVPDVGQPTELEWTWLDSLLSALSNHPIIAVISGSSLTASGEVCELSCVIWGKTISFSFCDWAWFFDDLGYFVLAFAVFYSVQIVFLYNR